MSKACAMGFQAARRPQNRTRYRKPSLLKEYRQTKDAKGYTCNKWRLRQKAAVKCCFSKEAVRFAPVVQNDPSAYSVDKKGHSAGIYTGTAYQWYKTPHFHEGSCTRKKKK